MTVEAKNGDLKRTGKGMRKDAARARGTRWEIIWFSATLYVALRLKSS